MTVLPFPPPPSAVLRALEILDALQQADGEQPIRSSADAGLDRPWEPASCSDELREPIWRWCGDVVAWINHEYAWRPGHMIPTCWTHHSHIARELPVLAVLRWQAENAPDPEPMEEWNRYAFPMFCDRMFDRLGESTCRTGKHQDWPAESRYVAFLAATTDGKEVKGCS